MTRVLALLLSLATLMVGAPVAHAAFGLQSFGTGLIDPGTQAAPTISNQLGAGAHPDLQIDFVLQTKTNPEGQVITDGDLRRLSVDLPRGLAVTATAAPTCSQQALALTQPGQGSSCPVDSQVGTVEILVPGFDGGETVPLFNMARPEGAPVQFGFNYFAEVVKINGRVRADGSYGLGADTTDITQGISVGGSRVRLWGVPADPVHDAWRFQFGTFDRGASSRVPRQAFISNPTVCGTAQSVTAAATSWRTEDPVASVSDRTEPDGSPYEFTGCDRLPFAPTATVEPTTTAPDSPSGLDLSVEVPQNSSPDSRASSHLRDLKVTLPPGMAINPSAADGLQACSSAQIGLGTDALPSCPDASTLGTATLTTPLLGQPLDGRVYLAKQGDNPFGTLLGLYLVLRGQDVQIKLAGRIDLDPATGQLVATFANNPQLPFSKLEVHLGGGSRAPLTTPADCGAKAAAVELTPWSGAAPRSVASEFAIDCASGLGAFAPTLGVGSQSVIAGVASPLIVNVERPDGQAVLDGLSLRLPTGLLAKLRGVARCASAQAAVGTCPAASRVGSASVRAGAGPAPFPLAGDVSLTGPYRGAPFGLAVRVRAVAGPLDLGTVVVRQALFIDPDDTHVTVVSDSLPTILQGIPIRLRKLDVVVDRRDFTVNPTSCAAKQVGGTLRASDGRTVARSIAFRVGGCPGLGLSPKLALRLRGTGATLRDGGHPALKAILTQPAGQSNLKRAEVKLPLSLALDPGSAQTLCEYAAGRRAVPACPKGSIVGTAKARTPLLDRTLSGPVYFVKGQRTDRRTGRVINTLPTLVVPLRGDGVRINLRAKTAVSKGRLIATFDPIPDAPVSRFDLSLRGGGQGILVANTSVCRRSRALGVAIRGHNGELTRSAPSLAASCR